MVNNLFLNRLLIKTDQGAVAYDESFHKGVNIIRGENSSGKSTITHFIFYVLGGAFSDFVPEARKCSSVYAEVEMNHATFTLRRNLAKDDDGNIKTKSPIFFYWGELGESLNPPKDKIWQKFNYNTTPNNKSFSNVIFENLNIPITKGDNNITIHQILRLLYIDQESPTSSLFYYEHFDSQITRETVSDLLLGVYDEELYENKKRLVLASKELDNVKSEIRATQKFFKDPLTLKPEHLKSVIEEKEKEISQIENDIILIRDKEKEITYDENSKLEFQELKKVSLIQRKAISTLDEKIEDLAFEIEDSQFFIETLKKKIKALNNSIQTRTFIGKLPIQSCPECLTQIKKNNDMSICGLCKEPIDQSHGVVEARRMGLEISFQIKESEKLLVLNQEQLVKLQSKYNAELIKLKQIQRKVNSALKNIKSYDNEILDKLNTQKGFIDGEILQYRTMLENAELYQKLKDKEAELKKEVDYLKQYIFKTETKQTKLKEKINDTIKDEGIYLLNNDLDRQDEFKNADEFYIDYGNNITFLSNKYSKYSASSNFYLKVSARFAIFLASLSVEEMRYPRFIFADNMEDKGIEEKRAQNLQKILIDRTSSYDSNSFQIIYTTSYITEELNSSSFVVGEFYSKTNRSLKNII